MVKKERNISETLYLFSTFIGVIITGILTDNIQLIFLSVIGFSLIFQIIYLLINKEKSKIKYILLTTIAQLVFLLWMIFYLKLI